MLCVLLYGVLEILLSIVAKMSEKKMIEIECKRLMQVDEGCVIIYHVS